MLRPDGALYTLEYSGWINANDKTRISCIEYTGSCRPNQPVPSYSANVTPSGINTNRFESMPTHAGYKLITQIGTVRQVELSTGMTGLELYNLRGQKVWEFKRIDTSGAYQVEIPVTIPTGILKAKIIYLAAFSS